MKSVVGYRHIQTYRGDTLQKVAARELGDASRWYELIHLNRLVPPYITDDPMLVRPGVVESGATIMVPSSSGGDLTHVRAEDPFGSDILMQMGEIQLEGGDFATVTGIGNLRQALAHKLITEPGDLLFHRVYGCAARTIIGARANSASGALAGGFVRRSLLADDRVVKVRSQTVVVMGDHVAISASVEATDGTAVGVEVN